MSTPVNTAGPITIRAIGQWLEDQGIDYQDDDDSLTIIDPVDGDWSMEIELLDDGNIRTFIRHDTENGITDYEDESELELADPSFFDRLQDRVQELLDKGIDTILFGLHRGRCAAERISAGLASKPLAAGFWRGVATSFLQYHAALTEEMDKLRQVLADNQPDAISVEDTK